MSDRIIIVHETLWQSILSDAFTFGCLISSISIGAAMGSDALQWIAGFLMVLAITSRAIDRGKLRMTVDEARAELDRIEAEARP